jgi:hypothetical protein
MAKIHKGDRVKKLKTALYDAKNLTNDNNKILKKK